MPLKTGLNRHLPEAEVIALYQSGLGTTKVARRYDVTAKTVADILKRNHIPLRNHLTGCYRQQTLDEAFFDVIDTEAKAYFLGLLFADGYVYDNHNTVGIAVQEGDRELVTAFSIAVYGCDRSLPVVKTGKDKRKRRLQYRVLFYSRRLRDAAIARGCVPRKSLVLEGPKGVPDHLLHHFVRGFFDGDGHMGEQVMTFTTTLTMGEWLTDVLRRHAGIERTFAYQCYNRHTFALTVSAKADRLKLTDFMYRDATIFLRRKYDVRPQGQAKETHRRHSEHEGMKTVLLHRFRE